MRCKRVGTLTVDEEVFDVLGVALHPHLHVLLGMTILLSKIDSNEY
jgi:hypothetical protein